MMMESKVYDIKIEDYNYPLPDERIAKHPIAQRDMCKLLFYREGEISEHVFRDVPSLLPENSTLVYNNTKVINARLRFRKPGGGALIEIFCLEPLSPRDYAQSFAATECCEWLCFVGNSKKWKQGALSLELTAEGRDITLVAERCGQSGNAFRIRFSWNGGVTFASVLDAVGEIPIPPYLNRSTEPSDSNDYQTVYSHIEGSVAAPTAGLHFTEQVLDEIDRRGIKRCELTLHVGAGTFQPVKSEEIGGHPMHREIISVSKSTIADILRSRGRVVAVGTTSVRTLESLYYLGCHIMANPDTPDLTVGQWEPYSGGTGIPTEEALRAITDYLTRRHLPAIDASTQIMIVPGFEFRVVNKIITNFHQPKSTLLLLISAFVGGDWRSIYDYALKNGFRFLSYGDSSLLRRRD